MDPDEEDVALQSGVVAQVDRDGHPSLAVELHPAHVREPLPHLVAGGRAVGLPGVLALGLGRELGIGPKGDAAVLVGGEVAGALEKAAQARREDDPALLVEGAVIATDEQLEWRNGARPFPGSPLGQSSPGPHFAPL